MCGQLIYLTIFIMKMQTILMSSLQRVCYLRAEPQMPINYIIEAQLCTHIIIGFASVNDNSIEVIDTLDPFLKRCKSAINELKSETLLMISIGGGGNDKGFHSAALTPINRKKFANSALEVILKYGFDGLDLDWEFPSWGNLYYEDKPNFNLLLREIRETFSIHDTNSSRAPLLLSAAVAAQVTVIWRSYDVPELIKYVDFINLMSYDYYVYHWYWPFVGHNSPLFTRFPEFALLDPFNTEWSANYWNRLGVHKSKIMVGIPTYGRSFRMAFRWLTIPGTLVLGSSEDMSYSQICHFLKRNGTQVVLDTESRVPYAYRGNQWLSYESKESAEQKVKWILGNGFGGVMTFSLNADDFSSECNPNDSFPIHSVIKKVSML